MAIIYMRCYYFIDPLKLNFKNSLKIIIMALNMIFALLLHIFAYFFHVY